MQRHAADRRLASSSGILRPVRPGYFSKGWAVSAGAARGTTRAPRSTFSAACASGRQSRPSLRRVPRPLIGVCAEGRWLATKAPVDRRQVRASWEAIPATPATACLPSPRRGENEGTAAGPGAPGRPRAPSARQCWSRAGGAARHQQAVLVAAVEVVTATGRRSSCCTSSPTTEAAAALYRKHGRRGQQRALGAASPARRSGERWDAVRMVKVVGPALREGPAARGLPQPELHVNRAGHRAGDVGRDLVEAERPVDGDRVTVFLREGLEQDAPVAGRARLLEQAQRQSRRRGGRAAGRGGRPGAMLSSRRGAAQPAAAPPSSASGGRPAGGVWPRS